MLKRLIDGFIFGFGFAIAFITTWYIAAYFITPMVTSKYSERMAKTEQADNINGTNSQSSQSANEVPSTPTKQFHELELDEKIKESSVIALAEYKPSADGKMRAIITEILKKEAGTTIYYNVGDEFETLSYYPKEKSFRGDGIVIFFTGKLASFRYSTTYSGDRILGLGDMPIKLLRTKCKG